jgi:peptidoglycan hydrolase-like protein with peptidoglycan-binding domain
MSTLSCDNLRPDPIRYAPGSSLADIQDRTGEAGITMRLGAKGKDVTVVQQFLNALNPGGEQLNYDVYYGPKTTQAVTDFQKDPANGLNVAQDQQGELDDKTLKAIVSKFQRANGLPETGIADAQTLARLRDQTAQNAIAASPAKVSAETAARAPRTEEITNGPTQEQARAAMTPEETRRRLDQALSGKAPAQQDVDAARVDLAQRKTLQGQLDGIHAQQVRTNNRGRIPTPDLDQQAAALKTQIAQIDDRLGNSSAAQQLAELDRERAAAKKLEPGWLSFFGESQETITARTAVERNVAVLEGRLGEQKKDW